ncbi:MAG: RNA-binding S4 domain-containing protein [Bacteroidales bacterium]|jgi:ribosome-associated protein|nr:RNA-binding S4 domain-containing protein [Bacteroidales bacterium]
MIFKLKEGEEYIHLIQLLKLLGIAESGAMAQNMVLDGLVKVNHIVDYRKRAKIRKNDVVQVLGKTIEIL